MKIPLGQEAKAWLATLVGIPLFGWVVFLCWSKIRHADRTGTIELLRRGRNPIVSVDANPAAFWTELAQTWFAFIFFLVFLGLAVELLARAAMGQFRDRTKSDLDDDLR